jgi:Fur family ferric uptake transcriptional regulator
MSKIESTFWIEHQIKKTKQRELILELLIDLDRPATIEAIYEAFSKDPSKPNLSTVYRALELFHKKNIVLKSVSAQTQTALYELNRNEHKHYMVCVKCQNVFPIENCPCELIENFVSNHSDFKMIEHKLEILGYCASCK